MSNWMCVNATGFNTSTIDTLKKNYHKQKATKTKRHWKLGLPLWQTHSYIQRCETDDLSTYPSIHLCIYLSILGWQLILPFCRFNFSEGKYKQHDFLLYPARKCTFLWIITNLQEYLQRKYLKTKIIICHSPLNSGQILANACTGPKWVHWPIAISM